MLAELILLLLPHLRGKGGLGENKHFGSGDTSISERQEQRWEVKLAWKKINYWIANIIFITWINCSKFDSCYLFWNFYLEDPSPILQERHLATTEWSLVFEHPIWFHHVNTWFQVIQEVWTMDIVFHIVPCGFNL